MIRSTLSLSCLALLLGLLGCATREHPVNVVINPYEGVDWAHHGRHMGNFHTHTTESDGRVDPAEVIDRYHAKEYDVLALTDHNKSTWPWSKFGRDSEALGMVAVPGNELSRHHHTLSLFSDLENQTKDLETSLALIEENGGVSVLAHPGRYWKLEEGKVPDEVRDRYAAHYKNYNSLVGMEVVNQGDRYPRDRALWDAVLTELMPERPVWGMANDDSHQIAHIGLNQTIMLLPEHTESAVRLALESGAYYFGTVTSHPKEERDPAGIPVIHEIDHDKRSNIITIKVDCGGESLTDDAFSWITEGGKIVGQGPALELNEVEGLRKYIRAEIRGTGGIVFIQPFAIRTIHDELEKEGALEELPVNPMGAAKKELTSGQPADFRFAHICDTQLGMGGYEHDIATFKQAVRQINELGVDFAVICGDLVGKANDTSFADFKEIKSMFKVPCYVVPGNHDVGNQPTPEKLESYRNTIGEDYFSFDHKGYAFLGVNTSLWKAPVEGETQKQDAWLDEELARAVDRGTGVFVFGHYPLYTKTPDEEEHYYNLPLKTRRELLEKFSDSGVLAILTGHAHKIIINEYEGMQLVTGQATSKTFGSPLGFRLWQVEGEAPFKHESVDLVLPNTEE